MSPAGRKPRRAARPDRRWPELPPHPGWSRAEELQLLDEATRPVWHPDVRGAARRALVEGNLRLIPTVAAGLADIARARGLETADLVQAGVLGLDEAIGKFDPARGAKFGTLAGPYVLKHVGKAVYDGGLVRTPRYLQAGRERQRRVDRAAGEGRDAERARRLLRAADATVMGQDALDGLGLAEAATPDAPAPDATPEVTAALDALGRLDPRRRAIVRWRFGLDGGEALKLREVGALVGLTRERVRQLEESALEALRSDAALREAVAS